MTQGERRAWGQRVLVDLRARVGDLRGVVLEIHAGSRYVSAIAADLRAAGAQVEVPTAHLRLGQQLAWYRSETA